MKNYLLLVIILFGLTMIQAQKKTLPQDFLNELEAEIGLWIADNSMYKNDQEPFESYSIEWQWAIGKKSITGKLYGLQKGERIGPFWEFRKFYDAKEQKAMLVQYGLDGTRGIGPFKNISPDQNELLQVFTGPDGSQYQTGHRTHILSASKHKGGSYSIDKDNNWILDREYIWLKQSDK